MWSDSGSINKSTVGTSRLSPWDNPSRINYSLESFRAAFRRRIKVSHPNLFAILGHLQGTTVDSQADVSRLSREMTIRHAKKRMNQRLSTSVRRQRLHHTRISESGVVSHSMEAHSCDLYTRRSNGFGQRLT